MLYRYFAPAKWAAIQANVLAILDQQASEMHRLGWTAPELFGLPPMGGTLHVNSCGDVMLGSGAAEVVHADRVTSVQTPSYRVPKD